MCVFKVKSESMTRVTRLRELSSNTFGRHQIVSGCSRVGFQLGMWAKSVEFYCFEVNGEYILEYGQQSFAPL